MKNLAKTLFVLFILSGLVFNVSAQTIKERIDAASVVKVYFNNYPIRHNPSTGELNTGTTCPKFPEKTAMPQNFIDASKGLIDYFNQTFNTTVFAEGDSAEMEADQSLKFLITTSGAYTVKNTAMAGQGEKLKNFLLIESYLTVMGPVKEKMKSIGFASVADVSSDRLETKECNKYEYFVENFPTDQLFEPYKSDLESKAASFVEKEMAKYEKEMKKQAKKAAKKK